MVISMPDGRSHAAKLQCLPNLSFMRIDFYREAGIRLSCLARGCTVKIVLGFQNFGAKSYFERLGASLQTSLGERWRLHSQYVETSTKRKSNSDDQLYIYIYRVYKF